MNSSTRKNTSFPRPQSLAPTDAEIIDIRALRCAVPLSQISPDNGIASTETDTEGEKQLNKQIDYIRSCVRKDKGLLGTFSFLVFFQFYFILPSGMMTENLQSKHIFSNDEPENTHILDRTPEDFNMDYRSIYLQTPDGEFIHAYWIYQIGDLNSTSTVLYLHGAGGNISHRLEVLRLFYENLHCNILIIDYRGLDNENETDWRNFLCVCS